MDNNLFKTDESIEGINDFCIDSKPYELDIFDWEKSFDLRWRFNSFGVIVESRNSHDQELLMNQWNIAINDGFCEFENCEDSDQSYNENKSALHWKENHDISTNDTNENR